MDYTARRATLTRVMSDIDVVALVPGANMKYFTGLNYHLSERPIVALISGRPAFDDCSRTRSPSNQGARGPGSPHICLESDKDGYQGAYNEAVRSLGLRDAVMGVDDKSCEYSNCRVS